MKTSFVDESSLKEMDSMVFLGQPKTIRMFDIYRGPFEFISCVAVFVDGSKMSIEKGRMYEIFA